MARPVGLEPTTSGLRTQCSQGFSGLQLSYGRATNLPYDLNLQQAANRPRRVARLTVCFFLSCAAFGVMGTDERHQLGRAPQCI